MTDPSPTTQAAPPGPPGGSRLERVLDGIAHWFTVAAGIALIFIVVSFGWLVWGRYVMNDTPTWVEQSSTLLIAWIAFIGAAVGVWRNTHLGIDFVREAMPRLPRQVLRVVAELYVILFGAFMAWQGRKLTLDNLDRYIPMLGLPEAWRNAPLLICGLLMILFAGVRLATGRRAE